MQYDTQSKRAKKGVQVMAQERQQNAPRMAVTVSIQFDTLATSKSVGEALRALAAQIERDGITHAAPIRDTDKGDVIGAIMMRVFEQ